MTARFLLNQYASTRKKCSRFLEIAPSYVEKACHRSRFKAEYLLFSKQSPFEVHGPTKRREASGSGSSGFLHEAAIARNASSICYGI